MQKNKSQSGFTLIETVIYLALFAMIFSGAIAAAYSIMESSGRNQARAMMQEEGEFLLAKINWAVSNAQTVTVPSGGRLTAMVATDTLEFDQSGNDITLQRNTDPAVVLNNSAVTVKNLFFLDVSASSNGIKGIQYGFDLEGKAANGAVLTSSFASAAYLRK